MAFSQFKSWQIAAALAEIETVTLAGQGIHDATALLMWLVNERSKWPCWYMILKVMWHFSVHKVMGAIKGKENIKTTNCVPADRKVHTRWKSCEDQNLSWKKSMSTCSLSSKKNIWFCSKPGHFFTSFFVADLAHFYSFLRGDMAVSMFISNIWKG